MAKKSTSAYGVMYYNKTKGKFLMAKEIFSTKPEAQKLLNSWKLKPNDGYVVEIS
jgi:hypothetical protein